MFGSENSQNGPRRASEAGNPSAHRTLGSTVFTSYEHHLKQVSEQYRSFLRGQIFNIRSSLCSIIRYVEESHLASITADEPKNNMCFYDQTILRCGHFKWGNCRAQCHKEYRSGETCGMKLVGDTYYDQGKVCKNCTRIDVLMRKRNKEVDNLGRWKREKSRYKSSIEKSERAVRDIDDELDVLYSRIEIQNSSLTGKRPLLELSLHQEMLSSNK